ncbi:MAG: arginine--tRNA ligase [Candidatus Saccharimonadales bacterium]
MSIRESLQTTIRQRVKECYDLDITGVDIALPPAEQGDYATNIAFQLAKELGRSPLAIAEELALELVDQNITQAEAAAPGFINLRLSEPYWRDYFVAIDDNFARSNRGSGEKVQVEYISANPTGPLTLGNARGGFIGDVLSNVLTSQGYEVTREYYFNDAGTQIGKLLESYTAHVTDKVDDDTPYRGEYMQEVAQHPKLRHQIAGLVESTPVEEGILLTNHIFDTYIKPALAAANITFDRFTNERVISTEFDGIRQQLDSQGLLEEREGALWLKSTVFGDERDRVLIKSSGDLTYLANDIAYHHDVFVNREFDRAIKVWGADHAGQVPSLKLTVNQLFTGKEIEFLIVQWVRLIKDGREFKISKRAGTYVTVDELVERVGTDVARWFMLMRSNDTHMDFDLDLAAEQSQKNPFWYVMYAYVRLQAINNKAAEQQLKPGSALGELSAGEQAIVRQVAELPELLGTIARTYEVHKLTFFGQELARLFHDWYEQEKIIDLPPAKAAEKLYFLAQLEQVFETYFALMGVSPRKTM